MKSHSSAARKQLSVRGLTVRNIVEQTPEKVSEVWCRKIYRHLLQYLERQYLLQLPHRPITPDTVIIDNDGTPNLLATISDTAPDVSRDMRALAKLIHFAITQEPASAAPLRGRCLHGYSKSLIGAVDRSMGPPSERPHTIEELRDLLGIVAIERALPLAAAAVAPHLNATDTRAKQRRLRLNSMLRVLSSLRRRAVFAMSVAAVLGIASAIAINTLMLTRPATNTVPRLVIIETRPVLKGKAPLTNTKPAKPVSEPFNLAGETVIENNIRAESRNAKPPSDGRQVEVAAQEKGIKRKPSGTDIERAQSKRTLVSTLSPAIMRLPKKDAANVPAASAAYGDASTVAAESGKVVLSLQIRPWGVVYVDGVDRGVSPPMKQLVVTPGHHVIRIKNSNAAERVLEVETTRNANQISIDFNREAN